LLQPSSKVLPHLLYSALVKYAPIKKAVVAQKRFFRTMVFEKNLPIKKRGLYPSMLDRLSIVLNIAVQVVSFSFFLFNA